MSKLDNILPKEGQSYSDIFEVHTLSQGEPDFECIHLTELGKQQIKDLFLELIRETETENTYSTYSGDYTDTLYQKVKEL